MRIKKEYKTLIPPLSPEEYQYLEENILKDGVREPLVVWGDILIDGHNRYEICQKHGITYKTVNKDFESDEEAERWIILNQFGRRNLTKFQRSELALKLKPMLAAQAKERQKRKPCDFVPQNSAEQKGETREDIAKKEERNVKKRSGYEETSVAFDILGQPKRCSNPDYIPSDAEYNALREVCPWLTNMGKQVRVDRAVKKFI